MTGVPDVRLEIDRTVDPGEYEAVQFGDWRRWHAVAPGADRTMCGLDHVNQRAQRMFHRWVLEKRSLPQVQGPHPEVSVLTRGCVIDGRPVTV